MEFGDGKEKGGKVLKLNLHTEPTLAGVVEVAKQTAKQVEFNEKYGHLPEKVAGLKMLSEKGVSVPCPRFTKHISAEVFHGDCEDLSEYYDFLARMKEVVENVGRFSLFVRSAHKRENEFGGGAFESLEIVINKGDDEEAIWGKIVAARNKIVEMARPENNLQVRRDIKFRGVKDFDPEDMDVLINEFIPDPKYQITVVPLDNGMLSLRVVKADYVISTEGISKDGFILSTVEISPDVDDSNLPTEEFKSWPLPLSLIDFKTLVKGIREVQSEFPVPQELEIQVCKDRKFVFVQAKGVELESTHSVEIPDKLFNSGVSTFFGRFRVQHVGGRHETLLDVEKASLVDEIRDTRVLRVRERDWLNEALTGFGERIPRSRKGVEELFELCGNEGLRESVCSCMFANYERLILLAGKHENYTVLVDDLSIDVEGVFAKYWRELYEDSEFIERLSRLRSALFKNASVLFMGESAHDMGLKLYYDHHTKLSVAGPGQIVVFHRGKMYNNSGPYFTYEDPGSEYSAKIYDDTTVRGRFLNLKDEDRLLVMARRTEEYLEEPDIHWRYRHYASLLPLDDDVDLQSLLTQQL